MTLFVLLMDNGQLTEGICVSQVFTWLQICQIKNQIISITFSALSFLNENRWLMYTYFWHPPSFIHTRNTQARGPRILTDLVSTRFLARFVLFHFSSSVYIPARMFYFLEVSRKSKQPRLKIKTFEFSLGRARICRLSTHKQNSKN